MNGFDENYNIIDSATPRHNVLAGRYKKSFAYYTLRERYPVILTEIIDNLNTYQHEVSQETSEEIKLIIGHISKLMHQLHTNRKFQKFSGQEPDKELWNNFIQQLPTDIRSFFHANWLYAECYIYRKLSSFFESTNSLKNYDYFTKQKQNALKNAGVKVLAKALRRTEYDFKTFDRLVKLNLWGNKCDLSIVLPNIFMPDENVWQEVEVFNSNILVNNTNEIWQCLKSADQSKPVIVEFVNDNAGFELFTDLLLADYLIEKNLASTVRFSVKAIPWFISDTVPNDVTWCLKYLSKHESSHVKVLANLWQQRFREGKFVLSPVHYFWVSPYEYYKMREIAPDLYQYLAEAHLIIFKGDLNYRKLLGDVCWDATDEFITCIRGFRPTNFCSLRILKADLVCGLPVGIAEKLNRLNTGWMYSGEYGLIQFLEKMFCDCCKTKGK